MFFLLTHAYLNKLLIILSTIAILAVLDLSRNGKMEVWVFHFKAVARKKMQNYLLLLHLKVSY